MGSEKYTLLDFAKYLSFSEVQKNSKDVNVQIRFQEELFQICYKNTPLEWNKFLVIVTTFPNQFVTVRTAGHKGLVVRNR